MVERKPMSALKEQQRLIQEDNFEMKAMKEAMGAMQEKDAFSSRGAESEVNLDSHVDWWHNKYHPRKPKYLKRVRTIYV